MRKVWILLLAAMLALSFAPAALAEDELLLGASEMTLNQGASAYLRVTPAKGAAFETSDASVARVNRFGFITAVSKGECDITAFVGDKSGVCRVSVLVPARKVVLSEYYPKVDLGSAGYALTARVYPDDVSDASVTWSSNNPAVATVDENGVITPHKKGNAYITAATANGRRASAYVTVRVPPESVEISKESILVWKGGTTALKATVLPTSAYSRQVKWTSSDPAVATVNAFGYVVGRGAGECVVTATSANGLTDDCRVTVQVAATKIQFAAARVNLDLGAEPVNAGATVLPKDVTDPTLTWSSGNAKVVSVDALGNLTPVGKGAAYVTAKAANGVKASVYVSVRVPPREITVSRSAYTLAKGQSVGLRANVLPSDAYSRQAKWTSSDKRVATVNAYGYVVAKGAGSCDITAESANGLTAACRVTVTVAATKVQFDNPPQALVLGGPGARLTARLTPSDATDKDVSFESLSPEIAKVDADGAIIPVSAGTATIVCATRNGLKAKTTIRVVERAQTITLSQAELNVPCGGSANLTATVLPASAGDKTVTWVSADKAVAVVDAKGNVYGRGAGECVVTAVANGGVDLSASCKVTVTGAPDKVICLTFDGGPLPNTTPDILDTLDLYGVKATFFMLGQYVDRYPEIALRTAESGHELGNHTYTHPRLTALKLPQIRSEIAKCDAAVYRATGRTPTVIRAPYGACNRTVASADAREFILWNLISYDAVYQSEKVTTNCVLKNAGDRALVLMHDTLPSTAQAIKTMIPELIKRGYTFVTASELMAICGYDGGDVHFAPKIVK